MLQRNQLHFNYIVMQSFIEPVGLLQCPKFKHVKEELTYHNIEMLWYEKNEKINVNLKIFTLNIILCFYFSYHNSETFLSLEEYNFYHSGIFFC